ncbi:type VII secretion-associated serine protease mycosin [Nocardia gipuzkoensis]
MRRLLACCAGALSLALSASTADAVPPPVVDPGLLETSAPVAPPEPAEQRLLCSQPVWTGPAPLGIPSVRKTLGLDAAWTFSRGAGQLVAVIDTGVNAHPRLSVTPGGDYVAQTDGTEDCDGHGTLVAGIIAAQRAPDGADGFIGVAPEAGILAIRQTSLAFQAKGSYRQDNPGGMSAGGYGTVDTLASAVVHAVDSGATVINISAVSCRAAGTDAVDGQLGAALRYAYDRNVVVVAAAGNVQQQGACKEQNGGGWNAVRTVATPAWFVPYVLSVGSVESDGAPSSFTLFGPWVGVAAPGSNLMSLDSKPGGTGLVNGTPQADGQIAPVNGTSFASAYVAGLAALVRARFPELTAGQVMDRIVRTAHAPGDGSDGRIGAGLIDPVAALTAILPAAVDADPAAGAPIAGPNPPAHVSPWPRRIGVGGAAACLGVLAIVLILSMPYRRAHRRPLVLPGDD